MLINPFKYEVKNIPVKKILLGGENDLPGYQYSLMTGDYMRPSTRVDAGPHTKLLLDYLLHGEQLFDRFEESEYYKNARQCIDLFGEYFPEIDSEEKIILAARRFVYLFEHRDVSHLPSAGHSKDNELIEVVPIRESDCYQLRQGNHRVAFAVANNKVSIKAKISRSRTEITPIQFLLRSLQWEQGDKIIYQPLPCPELDDQWVLARKCEDRFERMIRFIIEQGVSATTRILDLGAYYGWFVSTFRRRGYLCEGVEKDNIPIQIGKIAYSNITNSIHHNDILRFLISQKQSYDVVCCLSIMHHLISGRERSDPLRLLKLLDLRTTRILFFEMGQADEKWFSKTLSGWDVDAIENWVLSNTTFRKATRLGKDTDGVGQFAGNFGRMLFAFSR